MDWQWLQLSQRQSREKIIRSGNAGNYKKASKKNSGNYKQREGFEASLNDCDALYRQSLALSGRPAGTPFLFIKNFIYNEYNEK